VTDDAALTGARLALSQATRIVLRNGFAVLGLSVPETM
jgi:arginyl-tRNA synthetase